MLAHICMFTYCMDLLNGTKYLDSTLHTLLHILLGYSSLHVYIYVYVYILGYTYILTYTYIYIYIYIYAYFCKYTCASRY